jgi:L-2-hydroxyglutarate oxidase LhgO
MESVDCVVAGAGVIGLAIARALALAGREVILLEAAEAIGTQTSSRSSEVIHAGLYYPQASLMARDCVAGRQALYAYCRERGIPHHTCGKLIVATSVEELPQLGQIKQQAIENGVQDLRILTQAEAQAMEPALACTGALLSPSTGIIDSHAYMLSLQGDMEHAGGVLVLHSPVLSGRITAGGIELTVGGTAQTALRCRLLVNAAGLQAPSLARNIAGMPVELVPQGWFAKGSYFSITGPAEFSRLVYPVPVPGGLGVHLTLDLGGQVRFGPDVEWIERIDYTVDPRRADSFYAAIRRYWPGLRDGALQPAYAGIRPKIAPPQAPKHDFMVQGPNDHGVAGLINLFGIESPGLTSSLALADRVRALVVS